MKLSENSCDRTGFNHFSTFLFQEKFKCDRHADSSSSFPQISQVRAMKEIKFHHADQGYTMGYDHNPKEKPE